MRLFCIRDILADELESPFFARNEQVAYRYWASFKASLADKPHLSVDEFELVELTYEVKNAEV